MSFLTAFAGAVLNVLLNFLLIPHWGATGAAFATAASYFVVWILRTINVRRYLKFNLYEGIILLNLLLLSGQAFFLMRDWPDGWHGINWLQGLLLLAVLGLNLPFLFRNIRSMLHHRRRGGVPADGSEEPQSGSEEPQIQEDAGENGSAD